MIKPTKNTIIIKPTDSTRNVAGIDLPDREKDATEGEVISVGEKINEIKKGDYVFFSKYSINGREIKRNNEVKYVVLKESDILAIEK